MVRFILLAVLLLNLFTNVGFAEDAPLELIAACKPKGDLETIEFKISAAKKSAKSIVYVRQSDAKSNALNGVRFYVRLESDEAVSGTISVTQLGKKENPDEVDVPDKGGQVALQIELVEFESPGKYEGHLIAVHNGQVSEVAAVVVRKQLAAEIKLLGLKEEQPLSLDAPGPTLTYRIQLQSMNSTGVTDLRLSISDLVKDGRVKGSATLSLLDSDDKTRSQPVEVKGFELVEGELEITLPEVGEYAAQLMLRYGGKLTPVEMEIKRTAPSISVVGAGDDKVLDLTIDQPILKNRITLQADAVAVDDLQISVSNLSSSDAAIVPIELTDIKGNELEMPVSLKPHELMTIQVSGQIPDLKEYQAQLLLRYGNKSQPPVTLKVKRIRTALDIEIFGESSACIDLGWKNNDLTWWFSVHEKSGRPIQLDWPERIELFYEIDEKKYQAEVESVTLVDACGSPLTEPFSLAAGENRTLGLAVKEISHAGKLTGNIRASTTDGQSVLKPVSIFARSPGWLALVVIASGVFLSGAIRYYNERGKPRLMRRIRIAALAEDVERAVKEIDKSDDKELSLFDALLERMQVLYQEFDYGNNSECDTILKEIDEKLTLLPLWLNVYRRINSVEPNSIISPEIKDELEKVRNGLTSTNWTDKDLEKYRGKLQSLNVKIDEALEKDLRDNVDKLMTQIQALELQLDEQDIDETENDRRKSILKEEIREPLSQIDSTKSITEKRILFRQSQRELTRYRLESLLADIYLIDEVPPGLESSDWDKLKKTTQQKVQDLINRIRSPEARNSLEVISACNEELRKVYEEYLNQLIDGLADKAESIRKPLKPGDPAYDAATKAIGSLESARSKLKTGDITQAVSDYHLAIVEYDSASNPSIALNSTPSSKALLKVKSATRFDAMSTLGSIVIDVGREQPTRSAQLRELRARSSVASLTFWKRVWEASIFFVVLVVAVLLGLRLLWAADPVWGGFTSVLTAFLWGLGLHSVSTASAFGGIGWLGQELDKKAANPE